MEPSWLRTTHSIELFCHAHHVGMDLLSFIHDLILDAIGPQAKKCGFKLKPSEIALELDEVLHRCCFAKVLNIINRLRTTIEIAWIGRALHSIAMAQERCHRSWTKGSKDDVEVPDVGIDPIAWIWKNHIIFCGLRPRRCSWMGGQAAPCHELAAPLGIPCIMAVAAHIGC